MAGVPKVLIPKETKAGEARVAATPETVRRLIKEGLTVEVEAGAGESSNFSDALYEAAGASIVGPESWSGADLVLAVAPPDLHQAQMLHSGSMLIGLLAPHRNLKLVEMLAGRGVTSFAMELIPRVTKAQPMDALSSQASIAGYKAVLLAATRLGKYFPLLMTAAGTIPPARVVIMGAGVAGLQALATAKRLGAVVEVSDIREAVKQQVESLGGRFIELPEMPAGEGVGGYAREMGEDFLRKQREIVTRHVQQADVVITTALVPGKKAPTLLTEEMVKGMKTGAVIVDLAVEAGGNCEISKPDEEITRYGVHIIGHSNIPSMQAEDASNLYSRNVLALVLHLLKDNTLVVDVEDEITGGTILTYRGEVMHTPTASLISQPEGAR